MSDAFLAFCKERGIQRQLTIAHTPQQNGVAERKNRSIVEMARSMLKGKGLPNSFWAEAVNTAVYILNCSATKGVSKMTPQQAYSGKKPSVAHFKVFGSECFMHVPDAERRKLDPKSRKCIFLGYDMESKAYRLYDPEAKKVQLSRDVCFQEDSQQVEEETPSPSSHSEEIPTHDTTPPAATGLAPPPQCRGQPAVPREEDSDEEEPAQPRRDRPFPKWYRQLLDGAEPPVVTEGPQNVRRSRRLEEQRRAQANLVNYALMAQVLIVQEPSSFGEAQEDPHWMAAMDSEYDSILRNHTWDLVDRPPQRKVIGTKWVYKAKYNSNGTLEKYKARLVAKGFAQVEGFDFQETFAPTACMTTIRMVLALAAHGKWPVF